MYKGTQDKHDWIGRTGSHATRPILHSSIGNPRKFSQFDEGRLAELKDEYQRLLVRLQDADAQGGKIRAKITSRIAEIKVDIKRLNREASEASEVNVMWRALAETFSEAEQRRFSDKLTILRMVAQGASPDEIGAALKAT